jgi:hypothetical protein
MSARHLAQARAARRARTLAVHVSNAINAGNRIFAIGTRLLEEGDPRGELIRRVGLLVTVSATVLEASADDAPVALGEVIRMAESWERHTAEKLNVGFSHFEPGAKGVEP